MYLRCFYVTNIIFVFELMLKQGKNRKNKSSLFFFLGKKTNPGVYENAGYFSRRFNKTPVKVTGSGHWKTFTVVYGTPEQTPGTFPAFYKCRIVFPTSADGSRSIYQKYWEDFYLHLFHFYRRFINAGKSIFSCSELSAHFLDYCL